MRYCKRLFMAGLILCACIAGYTIMTPIAHAATDTEIVKAGDPVKVNYTVRLEDGSLVYSTHAEVAQDPNQKRAAGYRAQATFQPEEIVAGRQALVPGVGQSVVGMKTGEEKKITIPPGSAFGNIDRSKIKTYPVAKTLPKNLGMTAEQFVGQFGVLPVKGKEVQYAPFLKALVKDVTEHTVNLELIVNDGEQFKLDYGTVSTRIDKDEVIITMTPLIGAAFRVGEAAGKITGSNGETFTVDFNHPLAGKPIVLDIELVSMTKASAVAASANIPWIENHDEGLAAAKGEKKPAVMVLYADWCGWCKRLLNETIPDPKIAAFRDQFVWIKVNSDKQKDIYTHYHQDGFPLVILFDREGRVAKRINGFANAVTLQDELRRLTAIQTPKGG
ncbi:MAG: Thiol:disulfide interchange protein DsbD precursor [Syntrophorhabdus sp. PtaU1.Bin058]|nr:MAG: Thiol:disulfide interchange protein DsbD precursor [Syntrophorhabdus sp. PtaU1.Bin058]